MVTQYELDGGTDSIAKEKTVAELAHFYIERHAKLHKKTWTQDQYRIDTHILPAWRARQVKSITKIDVGDLFHKVSSRGIYEANRTLSLISKMFECAIDWGFVDETFMNPTLRIKKFKEEKRDRWVTHEELPKLMEAIEQEPHLYAREAIRMYLFTGTRKSELLRIKWNDINWQRKEFVLKDTKNGKTHYIPLSEAAIETLQQLPRVKNNSTKPLPTSPEAVNEPLSEPYIQPLETVAPTANLTVEEPFEYKQEEAGIAPSEEDIKREMIRQTMSELGKRSAASRRKQKNSKL